MKRILINAQQSDELRIALMHDDRLFDLNIESVNQKQTKSNIYKGVITRVEPSLEAAFVDYGQQRHGFLPFKEIHVGYHTNANEDAPIIQPGQELIIQVEKEERGTKGASLTTFVSLAGTYLVLMPTAHAESDNNSSGISRSLDVDQRKEMKEVLSQLTLPESMKLILRTSGVGKSFEELQWNLDYLLKLWSLIAETAETKPAPFLVYQEDGLIERTIRDYLRSDINEILIDEDENYQTAIDFVNKTLPLYSSRIKKYSNPLPLFNHFDIENQIENAFLRSVDLPSGGAIVIDPTEALISIDVNSGKATQGKDIEETALKTNLEAADEIARQLRLRDLGGLMVIDFIDMYSIAHKKQIEQHLQDALAHDRARVKINRISRFGLLEMSRQRLGTSLVETNQSKCPHCDGTGITRSIESVSLSIIRALEDAATTKGSASIYLQVPNDVATYLINEQRSSILRIEERQSIQIVIIPNEYLQPPKFELELIELGSSRLRKSSFSNKKPGRQIDTSHLKTTHQKSRPRKETPAIKQFSPDQPAPKPSSGGILAFITSLFTSKQEEPQPKASKNRRSNRSKNSNRPRQNGNRARSPERDNSRSGKDSDDTKKSENRNNRNRRPRRPRPESKDGAGAQQRTERNTQTGTNANAEKPVNSPSQSEPSTHKPTATSE